MNIPIKFKNSGKNTFNQVAFYSKVFTVILFISLPIVTFYIGYKNGVTNSTSTDTMNREMEDSEMITSGKADQAILAKELVYNQEYGKYHFVNSFSYDDYSRYMFSGVDTVSGYLYGEGINAVMLSIIESDQQKMPQIFKDKITTLTFLENDTVTKAFNEIGSKKLVKIQIYNPSFKIRTTHYQKGDTFEVIADNLAIIPSE